MWFQSPEYLLWSRKRLLSEQNIEVILSKLNITKDTRVLDVGCGSGELILRISNATGCRCVGLDLDETLIKYAKQFETNRLSFFLGNAIEMPFEDASFDIVISHTFYTTIFDAESAMLEMQRVCTDDGIIAAINAETIDYIPHYIDSLSACPWFVDYSKYKLKSGNLYSKSSQDFVKGLRPELIPQLFIDCGLRNVDVIQLGKFFSISSDSCIQNNRAEMIELDCQIEASLADVLEPKEKEEYLSILEQKKEYLLNNADYFDWSGGASLMVIANNHKDCVAILDKQQKYRMISDIEKALAARSIKTEFSPTRADVGSLSTVEIVAKDQGICVRGAGFTPLKAILSAYGKLLSQLVLDSADDVEPQTEQLTKQILSFIYCEEDALKLFQKLKAFGLESECVAWCLPKRHFAAAETEETAKQEALYDALATFAFKRLLDERKNPTRISYEQINDRDATRCINVLKRYGYNVDLFDISCQSGIPAVAISVFDGKGSIVKYAADYDISAAVKKCLSSVFENKKVHALTAGGLNIVSGALPAREMFNLVTTGLNILPQCFIKECDASDLQAFIKHENVLEAQEKLCEQLSLYVYFRHAVAANLVVTEAVICDARMIWSFSKKRMDELFLVDSLRKMIPNIKTASPEAVNTLANYMEYKLLWSNENTIRFLTDVEMFVPTLGVRVDYRLLLAMCYMHEKKYDKAAKVLPTHNEQMKCLKNILQRSNFDMIKKLYGVDLIANAQIFSIDPLGSIEA